MGLQCVGVAVCGGYIVWGLRCVGVGLCGGCNVYGHILGELWGVNKLNFHSKPKIFCFHFCFVANLTLELCFDQTGVEYMPCQFHG